MGGAGGARARRTPKRTSCRSFSFSLFLFVPVPHSSHDGLFGDSTTAPRPVVYDDIALLPDLAVLRVLPDRRQSPLPRRSSSSSLADDGKRCGEEVVVDDDDDDDDRDDLPRRIDIDDDCR